ncbi:MAG: aldo/keto reductase [Leptospirales bacterium]
MSLENYSTLGRTGLKISPLALGTMTFGTEWGWGSEKTIAKTLFDRYIDAGGNFVDTADMYTGGTSESWIGEFVSDRKLRDRVVITTKFSFSAEPGNPNAGGNGRKNILRAVEGSLKRLRTDYIDLYLLHAWDTVTPVEEVMRTFDDLVRSGKVRYVGLSDTPSWYAARAQTLAEWRGWEPISALQLEYSLVERNIEREFTRLCQELGMGIMAWSPLSGGLLSGKYRPEHSGQLEASKGRLDKTKDSGNPAFEKFTPRNWGIVSELEKVAGEIGRSMSQVSLNWVANRPGVGTVIIGATKLLQLEDNLKSLEFTLPGNLRERLDVASAIEPGFPYMFYQPYIQSMIHGGTSVSLKPEGYFSSPS